MHSKFQSVVKSSDLAGEGLGMEGAFLKITSALPWAEGDGGMPANMGGSVPTVQKHSNDIRVS